MKKIFYLCILITSFSFAQNQRFFYEYTFVKDTLNKDQLTKELLYLDISKEGSKFYSRDVAVQDSTMVANLEKQIKTTGAMNITVDMKNANTASFREKVFKMYPKFEVTVETNVGRDKYLVSDERQMNWKISPEKEKIGEYSTQKATTEFAGRKWTAWFAEELPFQDGPYKFRGLPGLIVKLEDESKTHLMEFKGTKKFEDLPVQTSEFNRPTKAIAITQNQYVKLFTDNRNDPAKDMKQMFSSGSNFKMTTNGQEVSGAAMIKKIESNAKEKNAKNNNLLEIDLLKK